MNQRGSAPFQPPPHALSPEKPLLHASFRQSVLLIKTLMGNTFAIIEKLLTRPLCIEWPKFCPHPWNYCSLCCTARYRFMGEAKEKVKLEGRGACWCVTDWNLNSVLLACKYKRRSSGIWNVFTFLWFKGNGTTKIHTLATFFPLSIKKKSSCFSISRSNSSKITLTDELGYSRLSSCSTSLCVLRFVSHSLPVHQDRS